MPGKVFAMKKLEDYDISPITGFLPAEPPLRRLTNPYFEAWESTMDDFNALLLAGRLRERVRKVNIVNFSIVWIGRKSWCSLEVHSTEC